MTEPQAIKRLVRIQKDKKIAGVCTGIAAYFNTDPTLIRLLWILLICVGGAGILLYLIAWLIMPLEDRT